MAEIFLGKGVRIYEALQTASRKVFINLSQDYFKVDEHGNLLKDRRGNLVKKDGYLIR